MLDRLRQLEEELAHVESQLGDPEVTSDRNRFADIGRRHRQLSEIVEVGREWESALDDAATARELASEADGSDADELREP